MFLRVKVPPFSDQLVYAETDGRAAILHINGTPPKALKVRMSLRSMEDKLCDEGFYEFITVIW